MARLGKVFMSTINTLPARLALYIAVAGTGVYASATQWDKPFVNKTELGGNILQFQEISYQAPDRDEKISPLCGCEKDQPIENWSGISFLAEKVSGNFDDNGDSYFFVGITANFPDTIAVSPVYNFKSFEIFDETYIGKKTPQEFSENTSIAFIVNSKVTLTSNSQSTVFSLLPPSHANVGISYDNDIMNLSSKTNLASSSSAGVSAIHMIDVLGPDVLIELSSEPLAYQTEYGIEGTFATLRNNFYKDAGINTNEIEKIYLKVPFGARVAFGQADHIGDAQPANSTMDDWLLGDDGEFLLTAHQGMSSEDYADFTRRVSPSKRFVSDVTWTLSDANKRHSSIRFRMPDTPPRNGFQVFGPIDQMTADGAVGSLTIGLNDIPFSAPSKLELADIRPILNKEGVRQAPLSLSKSSGGNIGFNASSEIKINGIEVNPQSLTLGKVLTAITAALALAASLIEIRPILGRAVSKNNSEDR